MKSPRRLKITNGYSGDSSEADIVPVEKQSPTPSCNGIKNLLHLGGCPVKETTNSSSFDPLISNPVFTGDASKVLEGTGSLSEYTAPKIGVDVSAYGEQEDQAGLEEALALQKGIKAYRTLSTILGIGGLLLILVLTVMLIKKKKK